MKIQSAAGDFGFDIETIGVEGEDLILIGKMGVWEATTRVSQSDLIKVFKLILTSRPVWAYLLRLPFALVRKTKTAKLEGDAR